MDKRRSPAETAHVINAGMERMMPILTPLGVVMGFLLPAFFINLRPLVPLLFGIMTLSGALKLRVREFGGTLKKPLGIALFFLTSHVLMPLAALIVSSVFFRADPDTVSGFILLYSVPTAVSGFIWVTIFRGDSALCLTLILLDTLLAPLVVPFTMSILMSSRVNLDMTGIGVSLVLMVVIPTIIGVAVNELSRGKVPAAACPYLNPVSKLCLILVIAANSSPVAPRVHFDDPHVWIVAALCIFLAALGYILSKLVSMTGRLKNEKQITLFFSVGLRNISAATTIAIEFFPPAAALPTVLGILFQQTMAAVMGRILLKKSDTIKPITTQEK
ncbi:MAG: bile acid:sodium symporter family protein [Treponema sp.]|jgi:tagaturonate reductase|nr:bile acid:sodium symporter family protein [Treponema sp.]